MLSQQSRLSYMKAMGIPIWATRSNSAYDECSPESDNLSNIALVEPMHTPSASNLIDSLSDALPSTPSLSKRRTIPDVEPQASTINDVAESLEWNELQNAVSQCKLCDIHRFRTQTVFGEGNQFASWMVVGESPDVEEDVKGSPFLGKSGVLLENILAAVGLDRESVYLANVIKCRPPNDRDPHVDEITNCMSYLQRQIELVQPKVIVVVGRLAAQQLLKSKESISRMRGRIHYLSKTNTPVVVTYHPRYLLRQASEKRKVWEDIKLARSVVKS